MPYLSGKDKRASFMIFRNVRAQANRLENMPRPLITSKNNSEASLELRRFAFSLGRKPKNVLWKDKSTKTILTEGLGQVSDSRAIG